MTPWESVNANKKSRFDKRLTTVLSEVHLQGLPWSGFAPFALASASDMYAPALVLPYHCVAGQ